MISLVISTEQQESPDACKDKGGRKREDSE